MGESARILVVDNNESIRKILKTVLEYMGYKVETAKTGEEALKIAKGKHPNLAIVDYSLIDMELRAFLKRVGKIAPSTQTIIVADDPSLREVKEMAGKAGKKPYPYLLKPFGMENALTMIREQLRKQRWRKRGKSVTIEFIKPLERRM
ncbi:MAG: response regulator [Candidatus Bathyarchaeia archaeon]